MYFQLDLLQGRSVSLHTLTYIHINLRYGLKGKFIHTQFWSAYVFVAIGGKQYILGTSSPYTSELPSMQTVDDDNADASMPMQTAALEASV